MNQQTVFCYPHQEMSMAVAKSAIIELPILNRQLDEGCDEACKRNRWWDGVRK